MALPLPLAEFKPDRKAFVVNVALLRSPLDLRADVRNGVCRSTAGRKVTLANNIDIVVVVEAAERVESMVPEPEGFYEIGAARNDDSDSAVS